MILKYRIPHGFTGFLPFRQLSHYIKKLRYQFIALSLRDELGRRNSINKNLEFRKLINVAVVVVLILSRLIVLDM